MAAAPAPPPPALLLLRPAGRCLPPAPRGTNITARPAQRGGSPRPAAGKGGGAAARRTPTRPTPRSSRPGPAARITCPAAANRLRPLPPAEQPGCRGDAAPARAAEGRALLSRALGGSGQPVRAGADRSEGRPTAVPGSLRMEAPRSSVTAPSRRGMVGRCRCKTYKTLNISEQLSSTPFGLCKLRPFPSHLSDGHHYTGRITRPINTCPSGHSPTDTAGSSAVSLQPEAHEWRCCVWLPQTRLAITGQELCPDAV